MNVISSVTWVNETGVQCLILVVLLHWMREQYSERDEASWNAQAERSNSVRDLSNESTLVSRVRDFARMLFHCAAIERSCVTW